jgi:hypothetical protein
MLSMLRQRQVTAMSVKQDRVIFRTLSDMSAHFNCIHGEEQGVGIV